MDNQLKKRIALMLVGVLLMGFFLSFLLSVGYGTDSSSFMNSSLATRLGYSLGVTMLVINSIQFIAELIWGRKYINLGTLCNMTLIGFVSDLTGALFNPIIPTYIYTTQPYRTITFAIALLGFLIACALYMNADMGLAPFDAIPTMIAKATKLPFAPVRIAWDFTAVGIGLLAGGRLTVGTIVLSLTVGPTVAFIGRLMKGSR